VSVWTFSFVDLAGYTAASWVHGDDVAARLSIRLCQLAEDAGGPEDVVIKSIGDAVMCRSPEPVVALEWLSRLFLAAEAEHLFPRLRGGSHHGPAVEYEGDFYGTAVNVAARVAALAAPCELLVTDSVRPAAEQLGWLGESRGAQGLRNIAERVEVWAVNLPTSVREELIDPVCRMRVTRETAFATVHHLGHAWWFCSEKCHDTFEADPAAYSSNDTF
jgi:adenylate cyclase